MSLPHHHTLTSRSDGTIPDNFKDNDKETCIVYKFHSRPPYEGFILILFIVVVAVILLWWLNSKTTIAMPSMPAIPIFSSFLG